MKNIKEANTIVVSDMERALLKSYVEALKDDDFKRLVTKLKINEQTAMKYTSKFENTVKELSNCKNCKGLDNCKNPVCGCVNYPNVERDGKVRFDYVACKYKKEQIEKEKNMPIIFEEPEEIKNAKMKDIDLTDKNRANVIKWIKKFYTEYSKNPHIKGAYIHGSFGSGKSYLVAALLNELALHGAKVIICYYPKMLRILKSSFGDNEEFERIMNSLETSDVLLLDDIGAETVTPWNRDEILGTILQYRMDSHLPTFFTSNLTIDELETNLSNTRDSIDITKAKRIVERIKQLSCDLELISENRRK